MGKKGRSLFLVCLLLTVLCAVPAFAGETVVTVDRKTPESSGTGQGYLSLTIDSDSLFTYPSSTFVPGDTAEGTLKFILKSGITPVKVRISAVNKGDQGIYDVMHLEILKGTAIVYDGNLKDLTEVQIGDFSNDTKADVIESVTLKLTLGKVKSNNSLQGKQLSFQFGLVGDMADYLVIKPADYVPTPAKDGVEVYQSLYNGKYYYPVSSIPALVGQYNTKNDTPSYGTDFEVNTGLDGIIATQDDFYTDTDGKNVYPGPDGKFGTADDRKDLGSGYTVERGSHTAKADEFGGGAAGNYQNDRQYYYGRDMLPGTADDRELRKGHKDSVFGTADDYYVDADGKEVYRGPDGAFGTADDRKDLGSGYTVERGNHTSEAAEFGGGEAADYQNDKQYYYGHDGIPGTADDRELRKGFKDDVYGTADDYYVDADGKNVFRGPDEAFGTMDDRKDLGSGYTVERGDHDAEAAEFGGGAAADYQNDKQYYYGHDTIPGTSDDRYIMKGSDGYGSADDSYDDIADGKKVYHGPDGVFGTMDDRKDIGSGYTVERGDHVNEAAEFGGGAAENYQNDQQYYYGHDEIPGTADDKELRKGNDGVYGTKDDYYTDTDGKNVFHSLDGIFGTRDDRKYLGNGYAVERGNHDAEAAEFGGGASADYQNDKQYYYGHDTIPGTSDDREITKSTHGYGSADDFYNDAADGLQVFHGLDEAFGTGDDRKYLGNGYAVERGNHADVADEFGGGASAVYQNDKQFYYGHDRIPGTADDKYIQQGIDGIYGTEDDFYTDTDGKNVFRGLDGKFGTEDDMKNIGNGYVVERGSHAAEADEFGGGSAKNYQLDKQYYYGEDRIPGTADDEYIQKGRDGVYGTQDDFIDNQNRTNDRPGKDAIWDTDDDETWSNGDDGIAGNIDDRLLGYPNVDPVGPGPVVPTVITGNTDAYTAPVSFAKAIEGKWSQDANGKWNFTYNGSQIRSKWVNVYSRTLDKSDWYYFDGNGVMQTGWQKSGNGAWYRLRSVKDAREGAMEKGLFFEPDDGKYYYLDPVTGIMKTGWVKINDKYYYFAETSGGNTWFWNTALGRWAYNLLKGRPLGSMYVDEVTPDGWIVDKTGARVRRANG